MASTIVSMTLALALGASSGAFRHGPETRIMAPGPGSGWGFPNGNPDGYGWHDIGDALPLGADRTGDYFFRRYFAVPTEQMFMPNYYNPYVSRGQRYIPYAGCGGCHPMGGPAMVSATSPVHPYSETIGTGPRIQVPNFSGRVEAPPINAGGSGLTP